MVYSIMTKVMGRNHRIEIFGHEKWDTRKLQKGIREKKYFVSSLTFFIILLFLERTLRNILDKKSEEVTK